MVRASINGKTGATRGDIIRKKTDGKTKFGYVYGKRYADVQRRLIDIKASVSLDTNMPMPVKQGTLANWLMRWLRDDVRGSVKRSTYQTYSNLLQCHILPYLGSIEITHVTTGLIAEFVDALRDKGLAENTIKNAYPSEQDIGTPYAELMARNVEALESARK